MRLAKIAHRIPLLVESFKLSGIQYALWDQGTHTQISDAKSYYHIPRSLAVIVHTLCMLYLEN